MSQTKYKLPDDLKMQCLGIVRGYERRVRLYHIRREAVIHSSPVPADGMPRGSSISDSTFDKVKRLEEIENCFDTRAMKAVEQAKLLIGLDFEDIERGKLSAAIIDSCLEGRNFNVSYYATPLGKSAFYERRREFLYNIAKYLGFI